MNAPSKLLICILRRLIPEHKRGEIEADLFEAYHTWAKQGYAYAWLRCWREVLLLVTWRVVGAWRRQSENSPIMRSAGSPMAGGGAVQSVAQDLRYGFRGMLGSPGFTVVSVLVLAIGIGANTTMFTLVNSLFLQAPPEIRAPEDLVGLTLSWGDNPGDYFSYPDYMFYRDNNDVFSDVMAYDDGAKTLAVGMDDDVLQADAWTVSYNFFDVLGVAPLLGRSFLKEEDTAPGEHPVVMISHGFWIRHFGSDPEVVNSTMTLNGQPFTVVGVVPREFRGPNVVAKAPDLYLPLNMIGTLSPGGEQSLRAVDDQIWLWLRVVARLGPEVDAGRARAHMRVLQARWESAFASWIDATFDEDDATFRLGLSKQFHLTHRQSDQLTQFLTPLFLAVGAVLLIACANVAILLLARASSRRREMGIRAALGAGRGRIVAQLLTESLLLTSIGGVLGITLAYWGADIAAGLIPMSFAGDFRPDISVFAFTLVLAGGAAVLFGVVPALQVSRSDITMFLHRPGQGGHRANLRNALVVGQLTLSIVLVTGAGLFVRSLLNAQDVDLGFERERRLQFNVTPENHGYSEEEGREFISVMLDRIALLPGVRNVSITDRTPFRGKWGSGFTAAGTEYAEERFGSGFNTVGPGYFRTMGIPIVAGREFSPADDEQAPNAVIVNEYVAQQVWPGENAVGRTIVRGGREWTVVGVAKNAVYYELGEDTEPQTYHAFYQSHRPEITFTVETAGDPMAMFPAVELLIRDRYRNIAISNVRTLDDVVARELGQFRVMAILVVLFGGLALVLSAVGLYGVQSFLVAGRTREIGIRMALGAFERQVAAAVMGRGLLLAGLGVSIGVFAAYGSAQLIQSMLFGVEARDPLTFVTVPIVLLSVALAASLIPAIRASRVDPVEALREE